MSQRHLYQVLHLPMGGTDHFAVLIRYADFANSDGLAFPTFDRVANKTGLDRVRVIEVVEDLVNKGIMIPDGRGGRDQAFVAVRLDLERARFLYDPPPAV